MNDTGTKLLTDCLVKVRNDQDKKQICQLDVVGLSTSRRWLRSLKILLAAWLVAVVCILIPLLHFVLVPLGILIGIYLFFRYFGQKEFLQNGFLTCPGCSHRRQLQGIAFNWPLIEECPQCHTELVIDRI